jgi:hypothetical protein
LHPASTQNAKNQTQKVAQSLGLNVGFVGDGHRLVLADLDFVDVRDVGI